MTSRDDVTTQWFEDPEYRAFWARYLLGNRRARSTYQCGMNQRRQTALKKIVRRRRSADS